MLPFKQLEQQSKACGFSHCALLDVSTIRLLKQVREMCAANTCKAYGKSWSCPPGLGTLEECEKRIRTFRYGLLVQTVGTLEDPFDYDSMVRTQQRHQTQLDRFREELRKDYPNLLALGAGTCTRCDSCTYPDAPCRCPEEASGSMEGYGMLVSEVCRDNGLLYYYGPNTVTFTGCLLLETADNPA